MAHRDRLLEADADTAACGAFERLFGLVAEVTADAIVPETVKRGTERVEKVREQVCQAALTRKE